MNQASSICRRKKHSWTKQDIAKYAEQADQRRAERLQRFIASLTKERVIASRTNATQRIPLYIHDKRVNFNQHIEKATGYLYHYDPASRIVHVMLLTLDGKRAPSATVVSLPIERVNF